MADRLHPFGVVRALRLLRPPAATLQLLADQLAVSASQVHAALTRLSLAGVLRADGCAANPRAPLACSPETYQLLALVDAPRLGEPKVRSVARTELETRIRSISA